MEFNDLIATQRSILFVYISNGEQEGKLGLYIFHAFLLNILKFFVAITINLSAASPSSPLFFLDLVPFFFFNLDISVTQPGSPLSSALRNKLLIFSI